MLVLKKCHPCRCTSLYRYCMYNSILPFHGCDVMRMRFVFPWFSSLFGQWLWEIKWSTWQPIYAPKHCRIAYARIMQTAAGSVHFRLNPIKKSRVRSPRRFWEIYCDFLHTCFMSHCQPVNERCVCVSFFARYLVVCFVLDIWALRYPNYRRTKKKNTLR